MRVLMFGWEFPPHIAGGLGTACEGIVKGLAYNGVETLFVMPSASGDEDQSATTIINASDVAVDTVSETVEEYLDKVKFIHIGTNMVPYADPEEFSRLVDEDRKRQVKDFQAPGEGLLHQLRPEVQVLRQVRREPHGGGRPLRHGGRYDRHAAQG